MAADLLFRIEFDSNGVPVLQGISKNVDEAGSAFSKAAKPLDTFIAKAKDLATVFGITLGVSGVVGFAREVLRTAGELKDLSAQTGIAASTLAGLKTISEQSGVSIQEFASGVRFMLRSLAESATESGHASDSLTALGFSVADIIRFTSDPEGFLDAFAKKISGIQNPAQRLAIAMDLASRAGGRLAPILIEIAEQGGLEKIRKDSEALGPAIEILDAFGDALTRFKNKMVQGGISKLGGFLFDTGAIKLDRISQIKLEIAREQEDIQKLEQSRSTVFGRLVDQGSEIFGGGTQARIDRLKDSIEANKNILELLQAQEQKPAGDAAGFVNKAKLADAKVAIAALVESFDLQTAAMGRTGAAAIALAAAEKITAIQASDLGKNFKEQAAEAVAAAKKLTEYQIALDRINRGTQATQLFEQQFGVEFDFTREKKGFDLAANFVAVFEREKNNPANAQRLNQAFSSFVQQALALGLPDIPNLLFRQGLSRNDFLQLRQNTQQSEGGDLIVAGLDQSMTAANQWGAVWDEKVARFLEGAGSIGAKLDEITSQFETLRQSVAKEMALKINYDDVIKSAKEIKDLRELVNSIPERINIFVDFQSNIGQLLGQIENIYGLTTGLDFSNRIYN